MSTIDRAAIFSLPVHERLRLMNELWDSISADPAIVEPTPAQLTEVERRLAEHDADPSSSIPWEEAHARLRARHG